MKKTILCMLLSVMAIAAVSGKASAQNANRKGWIIELQGGRVLGTLCDSEGYDYDLKNGSTVCRVKGGVVGAISAGYRWTVSKSWAVEAKLMVSDNFAQTTTLGFTLFPGVRYTTKEIAGNTSMYLGVNLGAGVMPVLDEMDYMCLGEFGVGFNIGNRISLGLYVDYTVPFGNGNLYDPDIKPADGRGDLGYMDLKSNATIGLKLGFRI